MAENILTAENNRDNLIGSAIISSGSKTVRADADVFSFFGSGPDMLLVDYVHPDDRAIFEENLKNCSAGPVFFVCRFKRYDGTFIELSLIMHYNADDDTIKAEMFDVIYMTKRYEEFIASNKIFNEIITMSDRIFFRYDIENGEMHVYNGRDNIFDGSMDTFCNEAVEKKNVAPENVSQFKQFCAAVSSVTGGEEYECELMTRFFNGEHDETYYPVSAKYSVVEIDSTPIYVVGTFASKAAGSTADSYISNRSNLDPLTGLLNKKASKDYALEALAKAEKENTKVTLVMIDLDNFKTINDTYGHMFGDETLVSVARVMHDAVGNRGVVGRIGGDEFFVVLTDFEDGNQSIRPVIREIRSNVELCFKDKLDGIKVTCSVGTATFPDDAQNYDDLFKLADHCLYVAKTKGRDRFIIYTKELHGTLEEIISSGTVVQMANFISEAHKSKHLLSVIHRFNSAREYDIQQIVLKKVMLEMLYYYDVDGVQYCPADDYKPSYDTTSYKVSDTRRLIEEYDSYKDEIGARGFVAIGSYQNAAKQNKTLYDYMVSAGLYSMMIITDEDSSGKLNGLFVISTYKRYQKWIAFDTNMLLILCRLMERFVR